MLSQTLLISSNEPNIEETNKKAQALYTQGHHLEAHQLCKATLANIPNDTPWIECRIFFITLSLMSEISLGLLAEQAASKLKILSLYKNTLKNPSDTTNLNFKALEETIKSMKTVESKFSLYLSRGETLAYYFKLKILSANSPDYTDLPLVKENLTTLENILSITKEPKDLIRQASAAIDMLKQALDAFRIRNKSKAQRAINSIVYLYRNLAGLSFDLAKKATDTAEKINYFKHIQNYCRDATLYEAHIDLFLGVLNAMYEQTKLKPNAAAADLKAMQAYSTLYKLELKIQEYSGNDKAYKEKKFNEIMSYCQSFKKRKADDALQQEQIKKSKLDTPQPYSKNNNPSLNIFQKSAELKKAAEIAFQNLINNTPGAQAPSNRGHKS